MAKSETNIQIPRVMHTAYDVKPESLQSETIPYQDVTKIKGTISRESLSAMSRPASCDKKNTQAASTINDFANLPNGRLAKRYQDFVHGLQFKEIETLDGGKEVVGFVSEQMTQDFSHQEMAKFLFDLKNDADYKIGTILFEDPKIGLYFENGPSNPYKPVFSGGSDLPQSELKLNTAREFDTMDKCRFRKVYDHKTGEMTPNFTLMTYGTDSFDYGLDDLSEHYNQVVLPAFGPESVKTLPAEIQVSMNPRLNKYPKNMDLSSREKVLDLIPRTVPPRIRSRIKELNTSYRGVAGDPSRPLNAEDGLALVIGSDEQNKARVSGNFDQMENDMVDSKLAIAHIDTRFATPSDENYFEANPAALRKQAQVTV